MPRGKYVNHKGKSRNFTNPDELEQERKNEEMKKKWRQQNDEESEEEEESADDEEGSDEESDSDDDDQKVKKGVHGLIEIENPNRVQKKAVQKVTKIGASSSSSGGPELSRREREEVEKQKAQAHYQKLHAEGKTEQAKADLARLAIIRQQREEAAKRRMEEEKKKETKK